MTGMRALGIALLLAVVRTDLAAEIPVVDEKHAVPAK